MFYLFYDDVNFLLYCCYYYISNSAKNFLFLLFDNCKNVTSVRRPSYLIKWNVHLLHIFKMNRIRRIFVVFVFMMLKNFDSILFANNFLNFVFNAITQICCCCRSIIWMLIALKKIFNKSFFLFVCCCKCDFFEINRFYYNYSCLKILF